MVVNIFGATSSPTIANYALKKTADQAEVSHGPAVADSIRKNFYVDNFLKSVSTEDEAVQLIQDVRKYCRQGGFNLTKFCCNRVNVLHSIPNEDWSKDLQTCSMDYDELPSERVLGVHWCVKEDTFGFTVKIKDKPPTRRGILSMMSSVFDPLGFLAPFILVGKKILQDLCREEGLDWDAPVADGYISRWTASITTPGKRTGRPMHEATRFQRHLMSAPCIL